MPRRIPLQHMSNLRDLGGYWTADGHETRWNVFWRSDSTHGLDETEMDELAARGLTDVIDLRSPQEVNQRPSAFVNRHDIRYRSLPLAREIDNVGIAAEESGTAKFYLAMAENPEAIRAIFDTLANARGIALFHCTAGKDRTGILASLLLLNARVPMEDVVADYMVSEWYIHEEMERVAAMYPDAIPRHFIYSKPQYIVGFLQELRLKYGSVDGYLSAMGVTDEILQAVRRKLIAE